MKKMRRGEEVKNNKREETARKEEIGEGVGKNREAEQMGGRSGGGGGGRNSRGHWLAVLPRRLLLFQCGEDSAEGRETQHHQTGEKKKEEEEEEEEEGEEEEGSSWRRGGRAGGKLFPVDYHFLREDLEAGSPGEITEGGGSYNIWKGARLSRIYPQQKHSDVAEEIEG
ncbi:hypothetical protein INR49_004741 [Caranx melampygus]|nr:hypothetical protein INR49_004741 [Caranx melampygus]